LLRTTCVAPVRNCATAAAVSWSRSSSCWAMASVQTTERYLGCKQNLWHPVNDLFDLRAEPTPQESGPQPSPSRSSETMPTQELECPNGGSEDDDHPTPICRPDQRFRRERTEVVQVEMGDCPASVRSCSEPRVAEGDSASRADANIGKEFSSTGLSSGCLCDESNAAGDQPACLEARSG